MQRISLFLALLIIGTTGLLAQTAVGVRLGYESASVQSTSGLDAITSPLDAIGAPNIGVFAEFSLGNGISFQPELQYTSRGFSLGLDTDTELLGISLPLGVKATSRFHYIEAPLLFKAAFGNETSQAYIIGGPSIGYATSGNLRTSAQALFSFNLTDTPINLDAINYQRTAINGIIGAGFQQEVSPGVRAFGEVRYTHGFSQLYDIPLVNERLSNQAIGANLGIAIALQ